MNDILKLKYKVGEIEFEVEGPTEAVEQQRLNFMNVVLPAAVEAMVRTRTVVEDQPFVETPPQALLLKNGTEENEEASLQTIEGFSRTSLASFLKKYGSLSEQNFVLFSAYFDEKKNRKKSFSIEDVKCYYTEARRPMPKNISVSTHRLAENGYIMDAPKPENAKNGNYYMLTDYGINYVDSYIPKETSAEKKPRSKAKKSTSTISKAYAHITADDLNITSYPSIKSLSGIKEQVIVAMYIVTNEGKGEWFTVDDVIYLLANIFDISASYDMVNGVFKRNRSMFASEQCQDSKKVLQKKLLSSAKDYAVSMIQGK